MHRTHEEIREMVAARVSDYVNGDASEDVLKASLKALGLDRDEINYEFWKASVEKLRAEKSKRHGSN